MLEGLLHTAQSALYIEFEMVRCDDARSARELLADFGVAVARLLVD
jgi:hypothetical protein